MKTRKNIIILLSILTVGTLISTVTALPYTQSQNVRDMMDAQEKLHRIVTSKAFLRYQAYVEPIANRTFNATQKAEIQSAITNNIIPAFNLNTTKNDPYYPELVLFLQALIDGILLIFGHNIIGVGVGYTIVLLTLSLFCCIEAILIYPLACVLFAIDLGTDPYNYMEDILYQFGYIGVLIFYLFAIPLIVCAMVLGGVFVDALYVVETFVDTLNHLVF